MIPTINLEDKIEEIDKPWSPIDLARVNDQVVRIRWPCVLIYVFL